MKITCYDGDIVVEGLKKSYGQGEGVVDVLKGLSCKISKGNICTLLGPSGSGKSTLLNILGGIESYEGGTVRVGDVSLNGLGRNGLTDYRRDALGFVFQFYNLVPNLTVRENIEVGAYLSDSPLNIDQLIDLLGLKDHQMKFPNQLSGGQQQRTSIGRALAKNPAILLCDEPTGALDYNTAKDVLALLQRINREYSTTIIIATHNTAISNMANQTLKMHDGIIIESRVNESIIEASELTW